MKIFSISGPIDARRHYLIDPLARIDLPEVMRLLKESHNFVLRGPRQVGKSSLLRGLTQHLNDAGGQHCLYVDLEPVRAVGAHLGEAVRAVLGLIGRAAMHVLEDAYVQNHFDEVLQRDGAHCALLNVLSDWCRKLEKPLVLIFDEIDGLPAEVLQTLMHQLRAGYPERLDGGFPKSVILCGSGAPPGKSPFDRPGGAGYDFELAMKARCIHLGNFSEAHTRMLLARHTEETGQLFSEEACTYIWRATSGQPWLVNALGYTMAFEMLDGRIRNRILTLNLAEEAAAQMVTLGETHLFRLDSLLADERVKRVLSPIIAGAVGPPQFEDGDLAFCQAQGLIACDPEPALATRLYRDMIPQRLVRDAVSGISIQPERYIHASTGKLNTDQFMDDFQKYYRKHIAAWSKAFHYPLIASQALFLAWLHRIGGGKWTLHLDYGLGTERIGVVVRQSMKEDSHVFAFTLRVGGASRERVIAESLIKIYDFHERYKTDENHLLLFQEGVVEASDSGFRAVSQHRRLSVKVWGL